MKLIANRGDDRVLDVVQNALTPASNLGLATSALSLFAFERLQKKLAQLNQCSLIIPNTDAEEIGLLGSDADRAARNRLQAHWLASELSKWISKQVEVKHVPGALPQSTFIVGGTNQPTWAAVAGSCPFTTSGLGTAPGNPFALIQAAETEAEWTMLNGWFTTLWNSLPANNIAQQQLLSALTEISSHKAPSLIYYFALHTLFKDRGDELDEDRVIKSGTGIRDTVVWKKLYRFQRDGVVGAIDKLDRIGGCIIADSVGLGKTFEALAVIKYYELRNDRVLVLVPKRLRDNWTLYKSNDKRNVLAADRLHYDVLNHTDLSRDSGLSGDIDLTHVNWGNYDLVVIDESHNFRNKATLKDRETRYDRLMKQIIKAGVKTRVLMLSATPVNNRLADLKNQIAFVTEGRDDALSSQNIPSIETTIRRAQTQFNKWLNLEDADRKPLRLLDMLGFDYFQLLDSLTIARSRKHIQKYYGTAETGNFPERLPPKNIKSDVDLQGSFPSIRVINDEIRRLNLAAYAPLRYVLATKQAAYDEKYSTKVRGGEGFFRQADREESLVHLLRVNLLKRMESSVHAFALTVQRQLAHLNDLLERIDNHEDAVEELSIEDIEVDDPRFESLLVGRKVKVLLGDVDRIRWRQDLMEDRNRLATLLSAANEVIPKRDAKLADLKAVIAAKLALPINEGNRKLIIFTAFADTAQYLFEELSGWAQREHQLQSALLTGSGSNKTTLKGIRADLGSVLSAFSPRSKERPAELAGEGELDMLIATDCISEGQNLQDCDCLINYDIHWNPVRIIQRFGRIDRIGSTNAHIQLINFWPNMELEEYINLEQRVSGRMVLLDVSATGEENLISEDAGNAMNDLEYRRKQLQRLKDSVLDLEDLSSGVSIADLTLNDFRVDLAGFLREQPDAFNRTPMGVFAVTTAGHESDDTPPGVIFCLKAEGANTSDYLEPGYPLSPYFLVHVGDDGSVLLPHTQAKKVLDRLRKLGLGRDLPDATATSRFDKSTRNGEDMGTYQRHLAEAISAIVGKKEERGVASLFTPGGTHALKGEIAGANDFEVVAYLVVLP